MNNMEKEILEFATSNVDNYVYTFNIILDNGGVMGGDIATPEDYLNGFESEVDLLENVVGVNKVGFKYFKPEQEYYWDFLGDVYLLNTRLINADIADLDEAISYLDEDELEKVYEDLDL